MDYFALSVSSTPSLFDLVADANRTKVKPSTGFWMAGNNYGFIESADGTIVDARDENVALLRSAERYVDLVNIDPPSRIIPAPKTGYFTVGGVDFKDQRQISPSITVKPPTSILKDGKNINVLSADLSSMCFEDLNVPLDGYCTISRNLCFFYKGFVLFNGPPNSDIGKFFCQMTDGSYQFLDVSTTDAEVAIPEDVEYIQFRVGCPVKVTELGFEPGFDAKEKQLLLLPTSTDVYYKSFGGTLTNTALADGPYYNFDGTLYANKSTIIGGQSYFFDSNGMKSRYDGELCQLIYGSGSIGAGLASNKTFVVSGTYPTPQATGTPFVVLGEKKLVVATDGTTRDATEINVTDSKGTSIKTLADGSLSTMTMAALPDGKYNDGKIVVKRMAVQQSNDQTTAFVVGFGLLFLFLMFIFVTLAVIYVRKRKTTSRMIGQAPEEVVSSV